MPADAVTRDKPRRIRRLAIWWLAQRPERAQTTRFDVASVRTEPGRAPDIEELTGAL